METVEEASFCGRNALFSNENKRQNTAKEGGIQVQEILTQCQETKVERVFEIDLHFCKLTKIENCQNFPKLRILDVSCNCIKSIRGLEKNLDLRELKLYSNNITKIEGLDKLRDLCSLYLQDNKISKINNGLQNLRKLKVLRLDGNKFEHITMTELSACSKITTLDISRNHIEDISFVNCLPLLELLNASRNKVIEIPDLGRCRKLNELDLSYNDITNISGLSTLPVISIVQLEYNLIKSLDFAKPLRQVEQLHIRGNKLKQLKDMATKFPLLELLDVSSNMLENLDALCGSIGGCTMLRELNVENNICTNNHLLYHQKLLKMLPDLEILDGISVKRPQSSIGKHRPPMRPVSASQMLSTKQLEEQVTMANQEQESFESLISSKFDIVYDLLKKLPQKPQSNLKDPGTETQVKNNSIECNIEERQQSTQPNLQQESPRPVSRCGNRARILDARAFAEEHFDGEHS